MSSNWWPERFTISEDAGTARFEVRNSPGFATRLSLSVPGGEEIAAIRRRRGGRFQVIVRGQEAGLVRQRAADRYDIQSAPGPLAVAGDVAGGPDSGSNRAPGAGGGVHPPPPGVPGTVPLAWEPCA